MGQGCPVPGRFRRRLTAVSYTHLDVYKRQVCGYTGIIDEVCPRCGRRDGEGVSLEKLHKLGLYRNLNADTIGYHGDRFEEADRRPNPLGCCGC